MTHAAQLQTNIPSDKANELQLLASTPEVNVWVAASAGTGKTTVLTSRILRLLLPGKDKPACPPDKILALTFTKAGANEMALRLNKIVRAWAVMEEGELHQELHTLLGRDPDEAQLEQARTLFAQIVDLPGGMKIMTIHSFCSSVLARFPLEAGLTPGFQAFEDNQSRQLQERALYACLEEAAKNTGSPEGAAMLSLARLYNEDQIRAAVTNIISERRNFRDLLERHFSIGGYYTALCQEFGIQDGITKEEMIAEGFKSCAFDEDALRRAAKALLQGTEKTDQPNGQALISFLDAAPKERIRDFKIYKRLFLTAGDEPLKNPITKKAGEKFPDERSILETEAQRIYELVQDCKKAMYAENTRDLFLLAARTLDIYTDLKAQQNALDFDDLILKTLDLASGRSMKMSQQEASDWVMYKLDQGLDHILVDEAQDTNPEQWEIIRSLADEFFSGQSARDEDTERTIFVVGDSKQSIFSFQRAAPEKFIAMEDWFADKIKNAGKRFEPVPITISFRSVPAILQAVDSVFAQPHVQKGLGRQVLNHTPFEKRAKEKGLVELWPLFTHKDSKEDHDEWAAPVNVIESYDPATRLAGYIAAQIQSWVDSKDILPKTGRPVQPGDILILMRTRKSGGLIEKLVRALKLAGIPVSGVDRMMLKEQLAVQDLLSAARFALQPGDDLSLAEFLKSPFIGWDDQRLFDHAFERTSGLYHSIRTKPGNEEITAYLDELIRLGENSAPFDFFSFLLNQPCPADPVSGQHAVSGRLGEEAFDPLDEFLNAALDYEQHHPPSLQKFLQTQEQENSEIKRDLEEEGGAVRIMTVHASKGLQAPIVILPDTIRYPNSRRSDSVLWPERSGAPFPVFTGSKKTAPMMAHGWMDSANDLQDEEYRRLMYVAMTRAQDRLYIGGFTGKKPPMQESWYHYIESGLSTLETVERFAFDVFEDEQAEGLRLQNPGQDKPAVKPEEIKTQKEIVLPGWIDKPAPGEPDPPRPLIPSRPSEEEQPSLSPLGRSAQEMAQRFKRGNLIHKLLQILPELPEEKREVCAANWLAQPGHDLDQEQQDEIKNEVLRVLTDPAFAPVFAPGSLAEVPVTGLVDEKTLISGQIDRLIVTEDEVYIIDYKTNRPPPQRPEDVPALYQKQIEAYTRALAKIYPGKKIRRALLWTYGPFLMEV